MFVRFVVGTEGDDYRDLTGVFSEGRHLADNGALEYYEVAWFEDVYAWFNEQVPVPPFSGGNWPCDVVSWFKGTALEPIKRIWDLIALLREHGISVRMLRSKCPGFVCYEDDVQVVVDEHEPMLCWSSAEGDVNRAVVERELPGGRFKVLLFGGDGLICNRAYSWDKAAPVRVGDVVMVKRCQYVSGQCFLVSQRPRSEDP